MLHKHTKQSIINIYHSFLNNFDNLESKHNIIIIDTNSLRLELLKHIIKVHKDNQA